MTNLDIARECGAVIYTHRGEPPSSAGFTAAALDAFVSRIRADEQEKCAKICDDRLSCVRPVGPRHAERPYKNGLTDTYKDCAAAIRSTKP